MKQRLLWVVGVVLLTAASAAADHWRFQNGRWILIRDGRGRVVERFLDHDRRYDARRAYDRGYLRGYREGVRDDRHCDRDRRNNRLYRSFRR
jgi:hypothetical protein